MKSFVQPLLFSWVLLCVVPAYAHITQIEIHPAAAESMRGAPAHYRVIQGIAYGEVDPNDSHNRIIQDIALAPQNARGAVEYAASFTLYAPLYPSPNATLLYDVVNRGGQVMPREYANGDYFLVSGWQADIPFGGRANNGTRAETIRVPVARMPDGAPVTGPVLARFYDLAYGQRTLLLSRSATYSANDIPPLPLDLITDHARLTTIQYEDIDGALSGVHEVPPSDWAWGDCSTDPFPGKPDATKLCLKSGADPLLLYQLKYTAKDPLVMGLGLAAIRDLNAFFRTSATDGHGFENPVAGHVKAAIATGVSQSGNTLRVFVNLGFNQAEDGSRVFDGVMPIVSIRQTPLNVRFGVPGATSMLYDLGTDGYEWWAHVPDTNRGNPVGGELDRCAATKTCPKIFEFMGSTEFYSLRASLAFTGTSANTDLPLPSNVRRYYFASTNHGGGNGGFYREPNQHQMVASCVLAANPNPENPTRRALLLALKQWILDGTEPPPSVYPSLRDGTLASASQVLASFPRIPGEPLPTTGALNPNLNYALGPEFHVNDMSGIVRTQPLQVTGASPTVLPTLDADGNEVGGIHSVQQQVPLGTYTGWNLEKTGFRKGQFCPLTGGYVPLTTDAEERVAQHDLRVSVKERYGTHEEFVRRVRAAAEHMVQQRFLLQDDADRIVQEAQASSILR